jgi:hypothetical protein
MELPIKSPVVLNPDKMLGRRFPGRKGFAGKSLE